MSIILEEVSYAHPDGWALGPISLEIPTGALWAIVGASGSGKSTLLSLMSGQLKPRKGRVWVLGRDLASMNRGEVYAFRKRLGFVFQNNALLTDLNVFDNLALPLRMHTELSEEMIRDMVLLKLDAVGLRAVANKAVQALSGGMARRVAFARGVILDPAIMFYDEPFTGLDPRTRSAIAELVHTLHAALGMSSVLISHDLPETFGICDQVLVLEEGQPMAVCTPQELSKHADPKIQAFLQGKNVQMDAQDEKSLKEDLNLD